MAQLAPADLVRRMFEARAQSDADGVIATLAPEVEIVALDGATYRGHDEIRDYFARAVGPAAEETTDASSDLFLTNGDRVLVVGRLYTISESAGIKDQPAVWEFVVGDGGIVRIRSYRSVVDVPGHLDFH